MLSQNKFIKAIFFGNYFYGLCVVLLSMEAMLQQKLDYFSISYYLVLFSATVLFYTSAYTSEFGEESSLLNERMIWYAQNKRFIYVSRIILLTILFIAGGNFIYLYRLQFIHLSPLSYILFMIFPLVGYLYYGLNVSPDNTIRLRNNGWLKPFIIGFVWAGTVTVYPVLIHHFVNNSNLEFTFRNLLLFVKNLMFIGVLCIMFDIKDYAADHNQQLKTFVVRLGLRKTIHTIIIPLSLIGLSSFITYAIINQFSLLKIGMNMIPFFGLISFSYTLQQRKSILYYLIVIDGLMLIKAVCGIIAMTFG